ncbi:LOW QUALITY PROTEIN: helicase SRCAP [Drosophila nasuta]|uniref:LOW QUALITY PROTEIN: helicase SRCAP n=1 Tax=Drosophila nasuta TaxID=42062 RepID=UPI00295F3C33|nr:LOW QUALITY PROTEIN: helicase SRCAP [Drosophila nasuta]
MAFASKCAFVVVTSLLALLLTTPDVVDARRAQGNSQRKTPSSGRVTQPPPPQYSNNADLTKLSYSNNYNAQPNRPTATQTHSANSPVSGNNNNNNQNGSPIGWNVPQQQGQSHQPVPAPAYQAPNYGAAHNNPPTMPPSSPVRIMDSNMRAYHKVLPIISPISCPPGATFYPSAGHMPNTGYHPVAAQPPPPGATYYQAGAALPPGATLYAQPPQQSGSSGPGFLTGALAGAATGAVVTHLLSSSGGSSSHPVAAAPPAPAAGQDRIIIINNGVPVNASDGTTVINAGAAPAAGVPVLPVNGTQMEAMQPAQLAPFAPENATMPMSNTTDPAAAGAVAPASPAPGSIICVPTKVNETDPTDSSKMVEVEKIACYPAPPPPAVAPGSEPAPLAPLGSPPAAMSPPLAPLAPITTSQPALLPPDQAAVRSSNSGASSICSSTLHAMWPMFAALAAFVLRFAAAGGN